MKTTVLWLFVGLLLFGSFGVSRAGDLKEKVKVETLNVGLDPRMDPGFYICAGGHLHIKGTVHNMSDARVGRVKVVGRVFGADGKPLGTATASTKESSLAPGGKAEIDLEFLTVTGTLIEKVKKHELMIVEAPARK